MVYDYFHLDAAIISARHSNHLIETASNVLTTRTHKINTFSKIFTIVFFLIAYVVLAVKKITAYYDEQKKIKISWRIQKFQN
jgi:hypothetical protein